MSNWWRCLQLAVDVRMCFSLKINVFCNWALTRWWHAFRASTKSQIRFGFFQPLLYILAFAAVTLLWTNTSKLDFVHARLLRTRIVHTVEHLASTRRQCQTSCMLIGTLWSFAVMPAQELAVRKMSSFEVFFTNVLSWLLLTPFNAIKRHQDVDEDKNKVR